MTIWRTFQLTNTTVVGTGQVLWKPDDLPTPPVVHEQVRETKRAKPLPKRRATQRQIPDHVEVEPLKKPSPIVPDTTGGPFKKEAVPTAPATATEPANVRRRSSGVPVGGFFGKPQPQPAVDNSQEVRHETKKSAPEVEKKVEVKKVREHEVQSASSTRELSSPKGVPKKAAKKSMKAAELQGQTTKKVAVQRKPRRVKTDGIGSAWD